jgi:AraC-like DNA-binding protein
MACSYNKRSLSWERRIPHEVSACLAVPLHRISLESCAAHVGLAPHRLSRLFRRATGSSFRGYVRRLRLERAELLLSSTDREIRSIAEEVGYEVTHFYRAFKSVHGVPPGAYREGLSQSDSQ